MKTENADTVQSVALTICANDGRKLEIPLEVWQVDVVCEMLGLCVDTADLDTYRMRSKERVDERMEIYRHAIRNLHSKE
ncbi:MAG: hypothetical protein NC331_04335 [Lachnospiraceae bacterium]|nr:hypothetical protein [Lachnospiraceae bacterium]MCM1238592.1 hypothetical protein [Lachnospiraceae bacterium]